MLSRMETKSNKPRDGRHCDLCGCSFPAVRCDKCGSQIFCLSCDDMYHRHPKRRFHLRKAVDTTPLTAQARPVLPMKVSHMPTVPGDPSKMPLPPPRKKKPGKSFFDSFRRGNHSSDNSPPLPKKEYSWSDRFGSIKKFMSNRPLPPLPNTEQNNTLSSESSPAKHDLSFIHKRVDEKPPQLPQRTMKLHESTAASEHNGKENKIPCEFSGHLNGRVSNADFNNARLNSNMRIGEETKSSAQHFSTLHRHSHDGFLPQERPVSQSGMHQSASYTDLHKLSSEDNMPFQGVPPPQFSHYPLGPHMPPHYPYPVYPQYPNYNQYFGNSWANLAGPNPNTDCDLSDHSISSSRRHLSRKHQFRKRARRSQSVMVDRMAYPNQFYPFGPFPPGYGPGPWMPLNPMDAPPSPASSVQSLNHMGHSRRKEKVSSDEDLSLSSSPLSHPKSSSSDIPNLIKKAHECNHSFSSDENNDGKGNKSINNHRRKNSNPRKVSSPSSKHNAIIDGKLKQKKHVENINETKDINKIQTHSLSNIIEGQSERKQTRSPSITKNDWECKYCTYINPIEARICQVCCKTAMPLDIQTNSSLSIDTGSSKPSVSPEIDSSSPEKKIEVVSSTSHHDKQEMATLNSALDEAEKEISRGLKELMNLNDDISANNPNANTLSTVTASLDTNEKDDHSSKPVYKSSGKMRSSILDKLGKSSTNWQTSKTSVTTTETQTKNNSESLVNVRRPSTSSTTSETFNSPIAQSPDLKNAKITVEKTVDIKDESNSRKDFSCQTQQDNLIDYLQRKKNEEILYTRSNTENYPFHYNRMDIVASPMPVMFDRNFSSNSGLMQRSHSRASLFASRLNETAPFEYGNSGFVPMYRSVSRTSLTGDFPENRFSEFHNLRRPDFYLSMEELVERRRQETMRTQGLELVRMIREAEQQGFTADDIQVALNNCGKQNPVDWLQENWRNMVETVINLSTNYGNDKKENDIGILSENEAREALRLHKGNIWAAVTECVEGRQRKFLELSTRGNFTSKEIIDALTFSQGDVELAYEKLTKSSTKPFLMRIWGAGEGAQNEAFPTLYNDVSEIQSDETNKNNQEIYDSQSEELWEDEEFVTWGIEDDEYEEQQELEDLQPDNEINAKIIKTSESDKSDYCDAFGSGGDDQSLSSPSEEMVFFVGNKKTSAIKRSSSFLKKLVALKKEEKPKEEKLKSLSISALNEIPDISSSNKNQSITLKTNPSEHTKSTGALNLLKNTLTAIKDTVTGSSSKTSKKYFCIAPEKRTIVVSDKISNDLPLSETHMKSLKSKIEFESQNNELYNKPIKNLITNDSSNNENIENNESLSEQNWEIEKTSPQIVLNTNIIMNSENDSNKDSFDLQNNFFKYNETLSNNNDNTPHHIALKSLATTNKQLNDINNKEIHTNSESSLLYDSKNSPNFKQEAFNDDDDQLKNQSNIMHLSNIHKEPSFFNGSLSIKTDKEQVPNPPTSLQKISSNKIDDEVIHNTSENKFTLNKTIENNEISNELNTIKNIAPSMLDSLSVEITSSGYKNCSVFECKKENGEKRKDLDISGHLINEKEFLCNADNNEFHISSSNNSDVIYDFPKPLKMKQSTVPIPLFNSDNKQNQFLSSNDNFQNNLKNEQTNVKVKNSMLKDKSNFHSEIRIQNEIENKQEELKFSHEGEFSNENQNFSVKDDICNSDSSFEIPITGHDENAFLEKKPKSSKIFGKNIEKYAINIEDNLQGLEIDSQEINKVPTLNKDDKYEPESTSLESNSIDKIDFLPKSLNNDQHHLESKIYAENPKNHIITYGQDKSFNANSSNQDKILLDENEFKSQDLNESLITSTESSSYLLASTCLNEVTSLTDSILFDDKEISSNEPLPESQFLELHSKQDSGLLVDKKSVENLTELCLSSNTKNLSEVKLLDSKSLDNVNIDHMVEFEPPSQVYKSHSDSTILINENSLENFKLSESHLLINDNSCLEFSILESQSSNKNENISPGKSDLQSENQYSSECVADSNLQNVNKPLSNPLLTESENNTSNKAIDFIENGDFIKDMLHIESNSLESKTKEKERNLEIDDAEKNKLESSNEVKSKFTSNNRIVEDLNSELQKSELSLENHETIQTKLEIPSNIQKFDNLTTFEITQLPDTFKAQIPNNLSSYKIGYSQDALKDDFLPFKLTSNDLNSNSQKQEDLFINNIEVHQIQLETSKEIKNLNSQYVPNEEGAHLEEVKDKIPKENELSSEKFKPEIKELEPDTGASPNIYGASVKSTQDMTINEKNSNIVIDSVNNMDKPSSSVINNNINTDHKQEKSLKSINNKETTKLLKKSAHKDITSNIGFKKFSDKSFHNKSISFQKTYTNTKTDFKTQHKKFGKASNEDEQNTNDSQNNTTSIEMQSINHHINAIQLVADTSSIIKDSEKIVIKPENLDVHITPSSLSNPEETENIPTISSNLELSPDTSDISFSNSENFDISLSLNPQDSQNISFETLNSENIQNISATSLNSESIKDNAKSSQEELNQNLAFKKITFETHLGISEVHNKESDEEVSEDDSSNSISISAPNPIDIIRSRFENLNDRNSWSISSVRPQSPFRRMSLNSRKEAIALEKKRDLKSLTLSEKKPWITQKSNNEPIKPIFQKRSIKQQLELERKIRKLVSDKKCITYRKAEIALHLMEMNFEEEESIHAANECSTLEQAISYLQQECLLCAGHYPVSYIISMVHCPHKACRECIRAYFTVQIRDRTIVELSCPFCNEPDISDEDVAQDYFNHLDIMLKKLVEPEIHELFQRKLRDRVLMKDPNFRWCSQCSSGFIAMPNIKRLVCPDCNAVTCFSCRRPWEKEHQGMTCEAFAIWKDSNDPEAQAAGLAKLLTEDGIDCPSCHFRYALAKGGCMHFKCIQCQHDFCSGCSKPFKMGQKCGVSEFCVKLGLHAHHPRNCLFYLRDKEPEDLQRLLDLNEIKYNKEPPDGMEVKNTCQVMEQKETAVGMIDDYCGKDVQEGFAGLCRIHYVEYLGQLVNKHKIDPIQIFEIDDLELVLRRANIRLPPKKYREPDYQYREKLVKLIQEELPLDKSEGS